MPDQSPDRETLRVAWLIRDYLAAHPHAADSVEGVMGWWVRRQQLEVAREQVQAALDYLVAGGVVTAQSLGVGDAVYSLATDPARAESDRVTGRGT